MFLFFRHLNIKETIRSANWFFLRDAFRSTGKKQKVTSCLTPVKRVPPLRVLYCITLEKKVLSNKFNNNNNDNKLLVVLEAISAL